MTIEQFLGCARKENEQEDIWLKLAEKYSPAIANVFAKDDKSLENFWEKIKDQNLSEDEIVKRWQKWR